MQKIKPLISGKYIDSELGEIVFRKNLRSRRMSIKILSDCLEVVLPIGFSEKDGMNFVESVRAKLISKQKMAKKKSVQLSSQTPLKTLTFDVHLKQTDRKDLFSSLKSGILTIEFPDSLQEEDAQTQLYFWNSINYFLRKEAKRVLPYRTKQLAEKFNFSFSEVKIQSSKTRWGSCNRKKTVNLSFYLLLLPQHLVDYVILHELCHTKEMNHSPKFWEWMEKVTDGKAKILRKELKGYTIPR